MTDNLTSKNEAADVHMARFTEWVMKEMPAGTIIGHPAWWAQKLLAAAIVTAPEAPAEPPDDSRDAERWRALIGCARVRLLGSAGLGEQVGTTGYAHVGVELWTHHEAASHPEAIERLTQFADRAAATKSGDCIACSVGNPGVYIKDGEMVCPHRPAVETTLTLQEG